MIVIEQFVYSKFEVNYYIVNLTSIIDFYKRKEGINQLYTLEFLEDFNTLSLYQCIYYKRKQGLNRLHALECLEFISECLDMSEPPKPNATRKSSLLEF